MVTATAAAGLSCAADAVGFDVDDGSGVAFVDVDFTVGAQALSALGCVVDGDGAAGDVDVGVGFDAGAVAKY